MKKDFYKEYLKTKKIEEQYKNNKYIIIENQKFSIKLLHYVCSIVYAILKTFIYLFFIVLLSVGATIIFNSIVQQNFINIIGG